MEDTGMSTEELETKASDLKSRIDSLSQKKMTVEAELSSRKRHLKSLMDECRKENLDPNNLEEEIQKVRQTLTVKLQILDRDVTAAEKILNPMIAEVQKG